MACIECGCVAASPELLVLAAPSTLPCSLQAAVSEARGEEPSNKVKRLLGKKGCSNAVNTKDVVSTSVKGI